MQDGRGVAIAFHNEAIRILSDRSVFGLIVLAPILYGLLYPQPYLGEVLRSLPIAVVDQDHTELSRDFVEALNADQALAVTAQRRARWRKRRRRSTGTTSMRSSPSPRTPSGRCLRGEQARIAAYVDAAYLLLYSQTLQGISEAAATASADVALAAPARTAVSLTRRWSEASPVDPCPSRCSIRPAATLRMSCRPPSC